jgi:ArsR family transcriptional regulator
MYALPLPDASFDFVFMQMVLHYAEDPAAAMAEARRVMAPGGRLIVVDLAPHDRTSLVEQMAHRRLGFADADVEKLLNGAGLAAGRPVAVPTQAAGAAPLCVRIWQAHAPNNVFSPEIEAIA